MIEIAGDLWEAHALGHWVAITTNGVVTRKGRNVMGRGVAFQAAERFPDLPVLLGDQIREHGNTVHFFHRFRIISFPVKHHWRDVASTKLIVKSAKELVAAVTLAYRGVPPVYMVRPGCGNGKLTWKQVRPLIAPILDDRFVIVEKENGS